MPHGLLPAEAVERICAERGVRLTALRRLAFQVLLEADGPVGAYDLLKTLALRLGRPLAPPTAYRALDFLLEQGFVSRIETRNAFVPCSQPGGGQRSVFFLCNHCGAAVETSAGAIGDALAQRAEMLGFQVGRRVVEVEGTCADCLKADLDAQQAGSRA
ncbi:transcriptional repressor [Paracoccus sp. S3-43]|uniref:transcriptional repressor n=1 Tax=Paracoccus sp. S3-43 TaxID=3030011 RepID=UPI0023AF7D65|nr:transcriptional repressor [Paracoccus sp. S3-43]WEF24864.1 transcriptional repressor [Paracoccus sp. S3-43]